MYGGRKNQFGKIVKSLHMPLMIAGQGACCERYIGKAEEYIKLQMRINNDALKVNENYKKLLDDNGISYHELELGEDNSNL